MPLMRTLIAIPLIFLSSCLYGGEERTCRIIYPMPPQDAPTEAFFFDGMISRQVTLSGMNFSEVISLPEGKITLAMTKNAVPDEGAPPPEAPVADVPAEWRDVYLILTADDKNPVMPVRLQVVDAGDPRLKPGQTLWINRTNHRIEAELGSQSLTLAPGGETIGLAPLETSGYYKAVFRYQPEGEGPFLPVMQKSWWLDIQSRNLGFIMPTDMGVPRIFSYRDHRAGANRQ